MSEKRIVFIVGHKEWGKSKTFTALKNGNRYAKVIVIDGVKFSPHANSNDDTPDAYREWSRSLNPEESPLVISALCPVFEGHPDYGRRNNHTDEFLQTIRDKGYELFFWVIRYQAGPVDPSTQAMISEAEMHGLDPFGLVAEYLSNERLSIEEGPNRRAEAFRVFVRSNVL